MEGILQLEFSLDKDISCRRLSKEERLLAVWKKEKIIPDWALKHFDLDQFYTKPDIARYCFNSMIAFLKKRKVKLSSYVFLEPSAGRGDFLKLFPRKSLGMDVDPKGKGIIKRDFLTWQGAKGSRYICLGNPPFGYRGWLAIKFLNHSAIFSDYVGFILPMSFQSEVRGSPKLRIKGLRLAHSEKLPNGVFENSSGKTVKLNTLWQIWEKGENVKEKLKDLSDQVDIFTVDNRKERLCGQEKMKKADFFLQRTFFTQPPKIVRCFSKVNYTCGYGFILKKNKTKIKQIIKNANWKNYSHVTTHNCHHISIYHIKKRLSDELQSQNLCLL